MDEVLAPDVKTYLTMLRLPDCELLSRRELQFPERTERRAPLLAPKNAYWANARLGGGWHIAVSPDNKLLALGYGVRKDGRYSDGEAYFSVYSLSTAQRLSTVRADVNKNNLWVMLFKYVDSVDVPAPLNGTVIFSPDSRTLFGGSQKVWQWDIKTPVH